MIFKVPSNPNHSMMFHAGGAWLSAEPGGEGGSCTWKTEHGDLVGGEGLQALCICTLDFCCCSGSRTVRLMVMLFSAAAGQEVTVADRLPPGLGPGCSHSPSHTSLSHGNPGWGLGFGLFFWLVALVLALYFMHSLQVWVIISPAHQPRSRQLPQRPPTRCTAHSCWTRSLSQPAAAQVFQLREQSRSSRTQRSPQPSPTCP